MPVHTDEAVNASILGGMLEGKRYEYDPVDRHGPTLYFATYPLVRCLGVHSLAELEAWELRLVPAVFGTALLAALLLLRPGLTPGVLLATSLWLGLGAPFVYYGRYWIHETLFVLLTAMMIGAAWRYLRDGQRGSSILAGASAGALLATKETAVVALTGAFVSLVAVRLLGAPLALPARRSAARDISIGIAAAVATAMLLFASLGRNPHGVIDALESMGHAAARAGGQGHEKTPLAYLQWLLVPGIRSVPWCGWTLAAFGIPGAVLAWRRRRTDSLPIFLLAYTAAALCIYSAIPYKTPWLELNFLTPGAVIAGIGLSSLCSSLAGSAGRAASFVLLAGLVAVLASETRRLCFTYPSDPGNPLAYSPTVHDAERLAARVEGIVAGTPAPRGVVAVVGADIWPLPWYLRHCRNVGYWDEVPSSRVLAAVVSSAALYEKTANTLGPGWKQEIYGLRPEVLVVLFCRPDPGEAPNTP